MIRYFCFMMLLILFSCKTKKENYYYWVTVDKNGCEKADITRIKKIVKSHTGDSTVYCYATDTSQIRYAFPAASDTALVISNLPDFVIKPDKKYPAYFVEVFSSVPNPELDSLKIQQYMLVGAVKNRTEVHYLDKDLGVYVIHEIFGPWRRYLQSTDSVINKKLNSLIDITFSVPNAEDYLKRCR